MKGLIVNNDSAIATRMLSSWISQNYNFAFDKLYSIDKDTIEEITNLKDFSDVLKVKNNSAIHYFAYNDDVLLIITQKIIASENEKPFSFVEIFAKDVASYKKWYHIIKEKERKNTLNNFSIEYHSFYLDSYGMLKSNVEYFKKEAFDNLSPVFYEPYLDVNRLFEEYLKSKSSILQLTGKPGIGKSKLVSLFIKYESIHRSHFRIFNIPIS